MSNAEEEDSSPLNTELEEEVAGFELTATGLLMPAPHLVGDRE